MLEENTELLIYDEDNLPPIPGRNLTIFSRLANLLLLANIMLCLLDTARLLEIKSHGLKQTVYWGLLATCFLAIAGNERFVLLKMRHKYWIYFPFVVLISIPLSLALG
jgi:hypothetical protein